MTPTAKMQSKRPTPEDFAALKRFGDGIRELRGERSISDIATLARISKQQYSNVECANNWPSVPVVRRICRVLKIKLPEILR